MALLVCLFCFLSLAAAQPVLAASDNSASEDKTELKGLVEKNGRYYYYVKGKPIKNTWKTVNGSKYYFNEKGKAKIGCGKIVKKGVAKYYFFQKNGKLYRPKSPKLVDYKTNTYYVGTDGQTLKGWRIIKNKLYYFTCTTGRMRKNEVVQGIKMSKTGEAVNNTASRLKKKTMMVVSQITNSSMSKSQKLYACWRYVVGGTFRYAPKYPNLNASGWQKSTALNMLETHTGNCYSYACAFAALAKEVRYAPVVVCGRVVGSRDHAADGYTRHSWVKIDGRHYDPEGQYAGWGRGIYGTFYYPVTHQIQRYVTF